MNLPRGSAARAGATRDPAENEEEQMEVEFQNGPAFTVAVARMAAASRSAARAARCSA